MNILLVTGGNSSERAVSLNSAKNVKKALVKIGHFVKIYDLQNGYKPIINLSKDFDVLFPVLHGEEGEGGKLHEFLSKIDKPIVGTRNYKSMKKAWPKIPFKRYCSEKDIPTSPWKIVKSKKDIKEFGFPCILKTSSGGSSREVTVVKDEKDLKKKDVDRILKNKNVFVEKYISGIEITVGILNDKALPLLEIRPTKDSWFSYKIKYDSSTEEIVDAPSVDESVKSQAKKTALDIHRHFDLGSYSRIDFMVGNGVPYVLELNTIPGLTSESLLPKQAKASGLSFGGFLEILLKEAK